MEISLVILKIIKTPLLSSFHPFLSIHYNSPPSQIQPPQSIYVDATSLQKPKLSFPGSISYQPSLHQVSKLTHL
jgi:hypothetical protein